MTSALGSLWDAVAGTGPRRRAIVVLGCLAVILCVPACSLFQDNPYSCSSQGDKSLAELRAYLEPLDGVSHFGGSPCDSGQEAYFDFKISSPKKIVDQLVADPVCSIASRPTTNDPAWTIECRFSGYIGRIIVFKDRREYAEGSVHQT
jgi:hypothetical protein